jgi:large subunit ribosomal protein L1
MPKRGKKYREAAKLVDPVKLYTPEEGVALTKQVAYPSFDASLEVHIRLGVDPRQADQQVRSTVHLPHGTGKDVRVLVFAEGETQKEAEIAGADYVGSDELVEKIQGGWFDFDVAVAVPVMMRKVGRLGRVLGPRGLMPSPKAGTVVQPDDVSRVVEELKAGRVEFRLDRTANLHVPVGKASFTEAQLLENFSALMEAVVRARPATAKGQYVRKVVLAPTMGPGIKIDPNQAGQLSVV